MPILVLHYPDIRSIVAAELSRRFATKVRLKDVHIVRADHPREDVEIRVTLSVANLPKDETG